MSDKNVYSIDLLKTRDPIRDIFNLGFGQDVETKDYVVINTITKNSNSTFLQATSSFVSSLTRYKELSAKITSSFDSLKETFFNNAIVSYKKIEEEISGSFFKLSYYDKLYEDRIKSFSLKQIPSIYTDAELIEYNKLTNTQTSDYSTASYQDTFLTFTDAYKIDEKNTNFLIKPSPYYNNIFIPNNIEDESSFSVFIKANIKDLERTIINKLQEQQTTPGTVYEKNTSRDLAKSFIMDQNTFSSNNYKIQYNSYINLFNNQPVNEQFSGKKTQPYEIIGYKIRKFEENTNVLAQEFFVSNLFATQKIVPSRPLQFTAEFIKKVKSAINFVDNQIKFGQRYRYEIKAIVAVPSFKYKYNFDPKDISLQAILTNENVIDENLKLVRFEVKYGVEITPKIEIIELDYNSEFLTCVSAPQIPQVDIFTKAENDKEVIFNLNIATALESPILIQNDDENAFKRYLADARDISETNKDRVRFSQNAIDFYEIFRIEEIKPTSYTDFADKLYRRINVGALKTTSFIDEILPNKKYYYVFRTGLATETATFLSNPSDIFEVELVNIDGGIYPIINILEKSKILLETNAEKILNMPLKSFRRYLAILPNPAHLGVNDNRLDNESRIIPSELEMNPSKIIIDNFNPNNQSKLWGKKFKIRITSKSSGRKIDLNMSFQKTDKKIE